MSKKELAELLAGEFNTSKADGERMVNFIFEKISNTLTKGQEVSIAGFGKFSISERAARDGRNPATGQTIKIPASKAAKFKAAKQLKDALN
ncbi:MULTISPECIES: HU family DNA-binding protein [Spiroplasma]|uniref:Transcriptional regulator n=2 Tax=Spiroplasma TaxID=2132 RepID=W0GM89_9MOLU|nr:MULTISPECIES: HU family DNA-binding protein [Spiroplasma]AHF58079.1 DNA-binding protein HU 1 [Spiroplasma eriocheiris CCTCC M 207170]AHF61302.1 DNA-binding protein HU 1 [Spiroplasma mirum ATCC 29335]AHI57374.1 transcriptional regulator [Spiroplasma mirum ATCC 29335]AKM53357.1 DNA-binding protein HU-beta [Spiroplasma atrichopogonis]AKM54517.1 DNA-binding protein HU-beta [Spiroplasma eriocheiris]